jgi:hypothetical protein
MLEITIRLLRIFYQGGFTLMEMASLVPRPEDQSVDLMMADWEFRRDVMRISKILDGEPTLEELNEIMSAQYKWAVYFSANHPDPRVREFFALEAQEQRDWDREQIPAVEKLMKKRGIKCRQN